MPAETMGEVTNRAGQPVLTMDDGSEWVPRLVWTAELPAVPGEYRYRYRMGPGLKWYHRRKMISRKMLPLRPEGVETQWAGPIPEPAEPAT